ncbi:E3 ubiquitin-protein ligase [Forsythia ovata]|uniref:E3 ubiquitin-protein ligase n=1 Tax=Forsythia ovata TaxID=205694 RepID=A0ABD1T9Y7_9LAMI
MSHSIVIKYLCQGRRDLVRTWMKLLAFVQGMSPQKRATGSHIEEEDENMQLPFLLGHLLANILSLLVDGAFSVTSVEETNEPASFSTSKTKFEDQDSLRHAEVGKLSRESSVSSITGKSTLSHASRAAELNIGSFRIPSSALWLTFECLRAIENWLGLDNTVGPLGVLSPKTTKGSVNNSIALKRTLSKFRRDRDIFKSHTAPSSNYRLTNSSEVLGKQCSLPSNSSLNIGVGLGCGRSMGLDAGPGGRDDNMMEGESVAELEGLQALSWSDWPNITCDVSAQDISVHIPLHRLLSMILLTALKQCYGESAPSSLVSASSADPSTPPYGNFLGHILGGCHPYGFSAFLMEHPLRIRVFCAEVRAGMWRRNGDDPILSIECYRSVRWSELGQDLDIFLLQCCAALAPPDRYVKRILERFGLLNYLSLDLEQSSEHEPTLVVEMLTLLIQIVKERRFCGLTTTECLQRELVYKLCIGDATRSQLVESLPRDISKINELQEILDTVAEYSNPSGMTQGMYKLRSAYWKELDLYHPRLNSRDLQVSLERYFHVFSASAFTTQLPKWANIYYPLRVIAQIATCETVLQTVRAVLFYAVFKDNLGASRAPDDVVLTALHLLALALDICQVQRKYGDLLCDVGNKIPILAFACEEICTNKYGDQSMISLLVLLMRIHKKENAKNFKEAGNFNLSYLIGDILKKFAEFEPGCLIKLQKLAPELVNQLSQSTANGDTNEMESASDSETEKRKVKARERQAAILEKMRAQQCKFLASINSSGDDDIDDTKSGQDICDSCDENNSQESAQVICSLCRDQSSSSPVSFLVLLQKSRLLSLVERGPPSWEQVSSSGKEPASKSTTSINQLSQRSSISGGSGMISSSQLVDVIQNAVNDFDLLGQPREVNDFLEFIRAHFPSIKNVQLPYISKDTREKTVFSLETLEEHMYLRIRGKSCAILWDSESQNKDDFFSITGGSLESSSNAESLLLGKYIATLSKQTLKNPSAPGNVHSPSDRARSESNRLHPEDDGFGPIGSDGICVSSCGHAVHQRCLDRYLSSLRQWYGRRIVREGGHIVDLDQGEFLCPVCRGLANSVLPASSRDLRRVPQPPTISTVDSMDADTPSTSSDRDASSLRLQDALSILKSAADVARSNEIRKVFPMQKNVGMRPDFEPVFRVLSGMYFPGQDKILESGRISHAIILWDALKYSIISAEIATRSRNNSSSANYSVSALYKEINSTNGFILSLLLNVTQSMRTENSLCVLLRLRGSQLFAESICSGTSPNKYPNYRWKQGGGMLYILENAEAEIQYPDIQFWEHASEPVLARDAFSSLMWTLFCLPWPFLSCKESYLSLVHAFYVVNITKVIITNCKKWQYYRSDFGSHDCLITDIYKFIGEHGEAQHCFDSNYINPAYDVKDAIRSLSFPYLRRCAFLWKLINHSNPVPFSDGAIQLDGQLHAADDVMEGDNIELSEVEKLEKMFNIPPLGVIITDEKTRLVALRWLHHLSEGSEAHKFYSLLKCTPAVPFRLMLLPRLYQDLLQRYIKKHCPNCGTVPEEPALCLLCGKMCSSNWKTCCRESSCQTHGMSCGAGIGVFLLIRRTTILLQRSARQTLWPSPYLDAFGEEDVKMHRGRPLFLNEERYAALAHMVASHGLDPSSEVFRQTTLGIGAFFMF